MGRPFAFRRVRRYLAYLRANLRIRKPPEMSRAPAPSVVRAILPPVLGRRPRTPPAMPPKDVPLPEPPLPEPPLPGNETLAENVASS